MYGKIVVDLRRYDHDSLKLVYEERFTAKALHQDGAYDSTLVLTVEGEKIQRFIAQNPLSTHFCVEGTLLLAAGRNESKPVVLFKQQRMLVDRIDFQGGSTEKSDTVSCVVTLVVRKS